MLRIIRGLPGSGKSYYAKNCFGGALVIEADQRFVTPDGDYAFEKNRDDTYTYVEDMIICACMHKLQHIIVTTASGHISSIQRYVDIAKKYGHEVRVMWLDHLNGGKYNDHHVPPAIIDKMKRSWEIYPGETYARRVISTGHEGHAYAIKIVNTPPPWYIQLHPEFNK